MTTETSKAHTTTSGRGALIGLAALFFIPLLGAFWLYYAGGWRPAGSTNHGELISPARPLAESNFLTPDGALAKAEVFRGKWTLLYIDDGACDATCRQTLWTIRQTRLLLAEDMDRVQRVFIAESNCCDTTFLASEHPGLETLQFSDAASRVWLDQFPRDVSSSTPYIFVVDPLGNLMMRFDATQNPKGLLEDIKKLLKLSHIG
jgi:cytochrome oxidase Cu insertion factor (SCO1/SenC/PrrC family)